VYLVGFLLAGFYTVAFHCSTKKVTCSGGGLWAQEGASTFSAHEKVPTQA